MLLLVQTTPSRMQIMPTYSSVLLAGATPLHPPPPTAVPKADQPPKLIEEEKSLLLKYNGCLKCCKPFVYHKGSNKAVGCSFPAGTANKLVTATTIASAMPASYTSKVASIVPSNNNTIDHDTHPVAAVFPGVTNLVDYLATNTSNVLGGNGDSDMSVSTFLPPPQPLLQSSPLSMTPPIWRILAQMRLPRRSRYLTCTGELLLLFLVMFLPCLSAYLITVHI